MGIGKWDCVVVEIDIWRAWVILLGEPEFELRSSLPGLYTLFSSFLVQGG